MPGPQPGKVRPEVGAGREFVECSPRQALPWALGYRGQHLGSTSCLHGAAFPPSPEEAAAYTEWAGKVAVPPKSLREQGL